MSHGRRKGHHISPKPGQKPARLLPPRPLSPNAAEPSWLSRVHCKGKEAFLGAVGACCVPAPHRGGSETLPPPGPPPRTMGPISPRPRPRRVAGTHGTWS